MLAEVRDREMIKDMRKTRGRHCGEVLKPSYVHNPMIVDSDATYKNTEAICNRRRSKVKRGTALSRGASTKCLAQSLSGQVARFRRGAHNPVVRRSAGSNQ